MIIGIVGNRKGWSRLTIYKKLNSLNLSHNDTIVTGGANGVDTFAMDYAKQKGINLMIFYPDIFKPIPERFYRRNEKIVLYSDRVIAFNKEFKSGTSNTVHYCNLHNVHVEIIRKEVNKNDR
jgi:predicted Rossmann fold nucleotide-binding protein DprA/Smf involved in DNA uptake